MSVQASQAEDVERSTSGQFSIPVGLMFGLLAAAVLCLGYGWLHRTPQVALNPDPGAIDPMLWRTTIVVGISAALVLGCYVVGGLNRIRGDWRSKFFTWRGRSTPLTLRAVGQSVRYRVDGDRA